MVPSGLAALLILSALIPAWLYSRLTEPARPRGKRSGLAEVLELLAVAAVTTGPPVLLFAVAPDGWRSKIFDPATWLTDGTPYLAGHLRGAALSLVLVMLIASLIASGLAWLVRKGVPDEFHPAGAVWSRALAERPENTYPWVGVMFSDGTLVEGVLHTIDLGASGDDRELALAGPIRVTDPGSNSPRRNDALHRLVIPAREIKWISAMHLPE